MDGHRIYFLRLSFLNRFQASEELQTVLAAGNRSKGRAPSTHLVFIVNTLSVHRQHAWFSSTAYRLMTDKLIPSLHNQ
ncbi:hypothetical protein HMPREF9141_1591 [Prevotella multiformis DSM 16608]|uniref:Uncharacterized protein n=1 Tax=Prevotella multiformis DSM 16608 TaxID=888743 RepID=F0F7M4_9BACT|nr:hypothetical protein HMPREF9141_1591 [Prevotella multiformis DSM 16608]